MSSGNDKEIRINIAAETSGADEARDKLAEVKQAAEEVAGALEGMGSSGGRVDVKAVEEMTEAVLEQVEANGVLIDSLDELTDSEAGVIRSTGKVSEEFKKLSEEAKKPDGFAKLFSPERMEGIKSGFGELGKAVGEFALEFSKTEEGRKLFQGLPEEVKVFGESAMAVADSVAKGFATGGPIGGAVSGLAALVQHVGKEYLDAQQRIEASNKEFAQAQAEHAEKAEARRKEAIRTDIEKQYQRELEILENQSEEMDRQKQVRSALRELQDEDYALNEEKERASGVSEAELKRKRIDYEATRDKAVLDEDVKAGQKRMDEMKAAHEAALAKRDDIRKRGLGTGNAEYEEAQRQVKESNEQFIDSIRDVGALGQENGLRKAKIDRRAEREHLQLDREESTRKKREEYREAADKKQKEEKASRERASDRVEEASGRLDRMAADSSGKFSRAADFLKSSGRSPELAKVLGGAGRGLSDGADAKEIAKISQEFAEVTKGMNGPVLEALKKMLDAQMKQAEEIRSLQGSLRNGGVAGR